MSDNKEQTGVQYLVQKLNENGLDEELFKDEIEKAKEIEKNIIWEYIKSRFVIGHNTHKFYKKDFEKYYTDTYGK